MTSLALAAIHGYKRHISPHKGFRCAHNALHGYGSCSDFGLRAYATYKPLTATRLLFRRFDLCKLAAQRLENDNSRSKRDDSFRDLTGVVLVDVCSCPLYSCL